MADIIDQFLIDSTSKITSLNAPNFIVNKKIDGLRLEELYGGQDINPKSAYKEIEDLSQKLYTKDEANKIVGSIAAMAQGIDKDTRNINKPNLFNAYLYSLREELKGLVEENKIKERIEKDQEEEKELDFNPLNINQKLNKINLYLRPPSKEVLERREKDNLTFRNQHQNNINQLLLDGKLTHDPRKIVGAKNARSKTEAVLLANGNRDGFIDRAVAPSLANAAKSVVKFIAPNSITRDPKLNDIYKKVSEATEKAINLGSAPLSGQFRNSLEQKLHELQKLGFDSEFSKIKLMELADIEANNMLDEQEKIRKQMTKDLLNKFSEMNGEINKYDTESTKLQREIMFHVLLILIPITAVIPIFGSFGGEIFDVLYEAFEKFIENGGHLEDLLTFICDIPVIGDFFSLFWDDVVHFVLNLPVIDGLVVAPFDAVSGFLSNNILAAIPELQFAIAAGLAGAGTIYFADEDSTKIGALLKKKEALIKKNKESSEGIIEKAAKSVDDVERKKAPKTLTEMSKAKANAALAGNVADKFLRDLNYKSNADLATVNSPKLQTALKNIILTNDDPKNIREKLAYSAFSDKELLNDIMLANLCWDKNGTFDKAKFNAYKADPKLAIAGNKILADQIEETKYNIIFDSYKNEGHLPAAALKLDNIKSALDKKNVTAEEFYNKCDEILTNGNKEIVEAYLLKRNLKTKGEFPKIGDSPDDEEEKKDDKDDKDNIDVKNDGEENKENKDGIEVKTDQNGENKGEIEVKAGQSGGNEDKIEVIEAGPNKELGQTLTAEQLQQQQNQIKNKENVKGRVHF